PETSTWPSTKAIAWTSSRPPASFSPRGRDPSGRSVRLLVLAPAAQELRPACPALGTSVARCSVTDPCHMSEKHEAPVQGADVRAPRQGILSGGEAAPSIRGGAVSGACSRRRAPHVEPLNGALVLGDFRAVSD